MWTVISCVSSAAIAFVCLIGSVWYARRAVAAAVSPLAKLRSIESRIASCEHSLAELAELAEATANRVKMMRVRNQTAGPRSSADQTEAPDPYRNPDEWRKMMNKRIAAAKMNGGA